MQFKYQNFTPLRKRGVGGDFFENIPGIFSE